MKPKNPHSFASVRKYYFGWLVVLYRENHAAEPSWAQLREIYRAAGHNARAGA